MRSVAKLLSVMVLLSMVLAGCGGGSGSKGVSTGNSAETAASKETQATASAVSQPAQPAKEQVTVKLGSSDRSSLKNLMFNLNSFGKDDAVAIDFLEYKGGSKTAQALLAGEVDVALLQAEHVLGDASGELVMISLLTQVPGNVVLVDSKYKDQVKSIQDLQGKKVGISSLGSGTHQFLLALLDRHGIDPSSMTLLPVGLEAPEIFAKGEVVATVTIEPFATIVIENGVAFPLVDARKPEGVQEVYGVDSLGWIALAARKDFLTKNPDTAARTIAAVRKSLEKIATLTIDELVAESPEYMYPNGDKALFAKMVKDNRAAFVADGRVTEKLLAPVWAGMQAKGAAPKDQPLPLSQVVASVK